MRAVTFLLVAGLAGAAFNYQQIAGLLFDPTPSAATAGDETTDVVLFTTAGCGYCKRARVYLDRRGIPYTDYDVERSAAARQRFQALGGRGVPLIIVRGEVMHGFSEGALARLLD